MTNIVLMSADEIRNEFGSHFYTVYSEDAPYVLEVPGPPIPNFLGKVHFKTCDEAVESIMEYHDQETNKILKQKEILNYYRSGWAYRAVKFIAELSPGKFKKQMKMIRNIEDAADAKIPEVTSDMIHVDLLKGEYKLRPVLSVGANVWTVSTGGLAVGEGISIEKETIDGRQIYDERGSGSEVDFSVSYMIDGRIAFDLNRIKPDWDGATIPQNGVHTTAKFLSEEAAIAYKKAFAEKIIASLS